MKDIFLDLRGGELNNNQIPFSLGVQRLVSRIFIKILFRERQT